MGVSNLAIWVFPMRSFLFWHSLGYSSWYENFGHMTPAAKGLLLDANEDHAEFQNKGVQVPR